VTAERRRTCGAGQGQEARDRAAGDHRRGEERRVASESPSGRWVHPLQRRAVGLGEDHRGTVVQAARVRGRGGERDDLSGREDRFRNHPASVGGAHAKPARDHIAALRLVGWISAADQLFQHEHARRFGEARDHDVQHLPGNVGQVGTGVQQPQPRGQQVSWRVIVGRRGVPVVAHLYLDFGRAATGPGGPAAEPDGRTGQSNHNDQPARGPPQSASILPTISVMIAVIAFPATAVRETTNGMEPDWVPPGVDTGKANIARVYDYWLGGNHNFRADQDAARAMIAVEPNTRAIMRANRAFLGRAVRFLAAEAGIRQFLDIGSGIPTEQNVHQVAQDAADGTRVIYVDNDEVAVAHSRLMLESNPDATVVQADLREPEKILADPATQLLIDFSRPVALLLVAVLHFIPDEDDPAQIIATLRDALIPGSYLVISHACRDTDPDFAPTGETVYSSRVAGQLCMRTSEQIAGFFDGFTLLEPGLVWVPQWRPAADADLPADPRKFWLVGGVGQLGAA
jgi:SAM-dependent methyltransferase